VARAARRGELSMTEHLLDILLVEDDEVDVMNVRRAFSARTCRTRCT